MCVQFFILRILYEYFQSCYRVVAAKGCKILGHTFVERVLLAIEAPLEKFQFLLIN